MVTDSLFQKIQIGCLWACSFAFSAIALGQDPFGEPSPPPAEDAFGAAPLAAPAPINTSPAALGKVDSNRPPLEPSNHPVILAIREHPPKTADEIARAILYLSRLRQWKELSLYMESWTKPPMTPTIAAQMVNEIGLDSWFAIRTSAGQLSDPHRKWLDLVIQKSAEASLQPSILSRYCDQLRSDQPVERKRGRMGLESAGPTGLAFFLNRTMRDTLPATNGMVDALTVFGQSGQDAWRAAMTSQDPMVRSRLLGLISPAFARDSAAELLSICYSEVDSPQAKQVARDHLIREYGAIPNETEAVRYLNRKLDKQLQSLAAARDRDQGSPVTKELWKLSQDSVLESSLTEETVTELERCKQLAICLTHTAHQTQKDSVEATAALLESDYQANRAILQEDPIGVLVGRVPKTIASSSDFMGKVFDSSVTHRLPGAQIRALQQMKLSSKLGGLSNATLVRWTAALDSGYPAIRYAAADAIASQTELEPFAGSHRAFETIVEMLSLEGEPLTLVIGSDDSLRDHTSQLLKEMGQRTISVSSGREALRILERPNPVESIMIVDQTSDISLPQLAQRLRSHRRGAKIPIAVLVSEVRASQAVVLADDLTLVRSYVPSTATGMVDVLRQLNQSTKGLPMQQEDRVGWRAAAEEFVRSVSSNSERQQIFPVSRWSREIDGKLSGTWVADASIENLQGMGTRESQVELGNRVISVKLEKSQRIAAATGLQFSIKKHGLKMEPDEVQVLYDAYNQQGRKDIEARSILSATLDSIEVASH